MNNNNGSVPIRGEMKNECKEAARSIIEWYFYGILRITHMLLKIRAASDVREPFIQTPKKYFPRRRL